MIGGAYGFRGTVRIVQIGDVAFSLWLYRKITLIYTNCQNVIDLAGSIFQLEIWNANQFVNATYITSRQDTNKSHFAHVPVGFVPSIGTGRM